MEKLGSQNSPCAGHLGAGREQPGEASPARADQDRMGRAGEGVKDICQTIGLPDATNEEVILEEKLLSKQ